MVKNRNCRLFFENTFIYSCAFEEGNIKYSSCFPNANVFCVAERLLLYFENNSPLSRCDKMRNNYQVITMHLGCHPHEFPRRTNDEWLRHGRINLRQRQWRNEKRFFFIYWNVYGTPFNLPFAMQRSSTDIEAFENLGVRSEQQGFSATANCYYNAIVALLLHTVVIV